MAFGSLLMTGVFLAVPLGVCVAGAFVVGRLGRRRGARGPAGQLFAFGSVMVLINVSGAHRRRAPLARLVVQREARHPHPALALMVGFALNAVLDGVVTAVMLRAQLRARPSPVDSSLSPSASLQPVRHAGSSRSPSCH